MFWPRKTAEKISGLVLERWDLWLWWCLADQDLMSSQVSALQMLKQVASTSMGGEGEPSFWAIRGKRPHPDLGLAEEPLQKRNFKPNGFNQIFSLANKKIDPEFWAVRGKRGFLWPAWWKRNPLNEETADFWATRGWAKCKDFGRFNF